ncbi:permease for cytosine/purines, uracil, thiamine, allantoin-domain-containing protein [Lasiosphaeria hispida]|uniref:Permease for cytosine/purines, uracil, thiamine, allantoin-domain-containing protein n=1 Tax=Lasiosphaeria hispida TaxID=260671 RepID=A0AAJ0ME39_9PEZI|nr:permease for cytosine/purines, uracil, thiamine, allantoin-domain-containing protein [Lasiosphaeria hispida]
MSSANLPSRAGNSAVHDVEKQGVDDTTEETSEAVLGRHTFGADFISRLAVKDGEVYELHPEKNSKWYQRLIDAGVEENGIKPVPLEQRTSTQYNNLFTVFFTCLLNILPIPTGLLATLAFGMGLRDASLVILFFAMLTSLPPAFMGIGGMQTGLRQLVQARYSFGKYLVIIPLLLNAATVTGFCLLSAIVGGQTLSSLSPDGVSVKVGIVITCLVSFSVSLLGFNSVHFWERWTWIPNLIALVIAVGCGGHHLSHQSVLEPATPAQALSYGGLIAGYFITFSGTASDYSIYHKPKGVSKVKIFMYIYLGLLLPSVPLLILGAAIGGAVPNVPSWNAAYQVTGVGGVLYEMLTPAGGFGKFIIVLLALSVIGNIAISMYSVSLNLQMLLPPFTKVPRFVFILATMAIMIPLAIKAAEEWEESLTNFLAVIGYWAGCFAAVSILELVVFRRMDYSTYEHSIWNVGRKLPPGVAALGASLCSMGLVVPGMAEPWFTGPIAKTTGDIGFEMAFAVTALCYLPFRWLEIRLRGHL